ncbi:hypothetical protein Hdeb2414_s0304g00861461 [Helianthus debilis subsp. tardiflorus]
MEVFVQERQLSAPEAHSSSTPKPDTQPKPVTQPNPVTQPSKPEAQSSRVSPGCSSNSIGKQADKDSEDSEFIVQDEESNSDELVETSDEEEAADDVLGLESDKEDDEWIQSQHAVREATKIHLDAKKKVLDEVVHDRQTEGNLHETEGNLHETEQARVDGNSSYEESDGDILTPGDSEDDDIRGKKYKEAVPSVGEHTNWKKFI